MRLLLDTHIWIWSISLPHRDPADTFLAATALVFGLTLVTSDVRLLSVKGLAVLANR